MVITKQDYYKERGRAYALEDPEAVIRYKRCMRWITPKPGLAVREIGCKFGMFLDMLSESVESVDYVGIDIDETTLKKIAAYNERQFLCFDVNDGLPFEDNSADHVICLEVVEHLENPTFLFEEVK